MSEHIIDSILESMIEGLWWNKSTIVVKFEDKRRFGNRVVKRVRREVTGGIISGNIFQGGGKMHFNDELRTIRLTGRVALGRVRKPLIKAAYNPWAGKDAVSVIVKRTAITL